MYFICIQNDDFAFLSRVAEKSARVDSDVEFWADHSSDEDDDDDDSEEEGVEFEFEEEDRLVSHDLGLPICC